MLPADWIETMLVPSARHAGYGLFTWLGAGLAASAQAARAAGRNGAMNGRLNLFQTGMLRWRDLYPYNAVHVVRVDAPLDRTTTTPYGEATVSHVCLNDDVVEGLELRSPDGRLTAFSVQYHPEAAAGPHAAVTGHARADRLETIT